MGRTYQSTVVNAPAEKVWATIRNFHDFSWAPNVIQKCEAQGDKKGDQVGARRLLNGAIHETLLDLNDMERTIKYSIDDGPSPVSKSEVRNYVGVLRVLPITEGSGSFVEWSSSWDMNDAKATEFCHGVYVALLGDLRKTLG